MDLRATLRNYDKEFLWDCIVENGHTTCPDNITRLYNNLAKKEYTEENSFAFRKQVKTLENLIYREKRSLGLPVYTNVDDSGVYYLQLLAKQIPGQICIFEKYFVVNQFSGIVTINAKIDEIKEIIDNCKYSRVIIPMYIRIRETKKIGYHLNLLIVDIPSRKVYRIEPNDVSKQNINNFENALRAFFRPLNLTFSGFYDDTCPIKHGGLCRYVAYAQYIHGKNMTYAKVKEVILQFLKQDLRDICGLR
jgi:hypothetical protein